jgi:hypothetical protein
LIYDETQPISKEKNEEIFEIPPSQVAANHH